MPGLINLVGDMFGKLVVVARALPPPDKVWLDPRWVCLCSCGTWRVVVGSCLRGGITKSCGCIQRQRIENAVRKAPEYRAHQQMIQRCENQNFISYHRYGGRGIKVCARWKKSYINFLADVGPRPSVKHTLDRIDNDGNYCPSNVRWATRKQQSRNTSKTLRVSYKGKLRPLAEAVEMAGNVVSLSLAGRRIFTYGFPVAKSLETPALQMRVK